MNVTAIPALDDWAGYEEDMDARYAYDVFFGKSHAEVQPDIRRNVIERTDEIRFMPVKPFQYYIFALRDYIVEENYSNDDAADAVNCFFDLVIDKLKHHPSFILPVIYALLSSIEFIACHAEKYGIDEQIYGSLQLKFAEIMKQVEQRA